MGISATTGLTSGTDYSTLIDKLITADKQAITPTEEKKTTAESTLTTVQELNTSFSYVTADAETMAEEDTFRSRTTTVGDEDVLTASASSSASVGTYRIRVDAIAQAEQQLGSAVDGDGTWSGTLTLAVGDGETFTYEAEDATLTVLAAAINRSTTAGVTAQVIAVGDGTSRLLLTSDDSGAANTISIGGDLAAEGPFAGMTTITAAQDASITLQLGSDSSVEITRTSSSNSITDVVEGLDLALKTVSSDFTTVTVATDTTAIANRLQLLVEDLNTALSAYGTAASYSSTTETSGVLFSNGLIRSQVNALNAAMATITSSGASLEDLGITYDISTGQYDLDSDTLSTLLEGDPDAAARIMIDEGIGALILSAAEGLTDSSTGVLVTEEDALDASIDLYEDQIEDFNASLEEKRSRYQAQFLALEKALTSLNSQKQTIEAFADSLSGSD